MSPKQVSDLAPSNLTRVICTEQYSRWVGAKVGNKDTLFPDSLFVQIYINHLHQIFIIIINWYLNYQRKFFFFDK